MPAAAKQSFRGSSNILLRLRFNEQKWRTTREFASFRPPRGAGEPTAKPKDLLRLSPLLQAPSDQILEAVRKLGLEGIVGKRTNSPYEPGERSGAWIKLRTNMEQEFVICGYVPGTRGFDALLVGVYENNETHLRRKS